MLITAKARLTIDLLSHGLTHLVMKTVTSAKLYEQSQHDTPAFDRKQPETSLLQQQMQETGQSSQSMRAAPVNCTGTFGGNIGTAVDVEDLKQENKKLKADLKLSRDQLKSVIGTLGTFQIFVHEKFNKLDSEIRDLKRQLAEKQVQSPRATLGHNSLL